MKSWQLDAALSQADGYDRWTENIRGTEATCSFNARHFVQVLRARPEPAGRLTVMGKGYSLSISLSDYPPGNPDE
jgi:hypothetical protein